MESNFILLSLKFLNQDCAPLCELSQVLELDNLVQAALDPNARTWWRTRRQPPEFVGEEYSLRSYRAILSVTWMLHRMTKASQVNTATLLQYKTQIILKKLWALPNEELQLFCLKIFKTLCPYLGRKWKQGNTSLLSAIYNRCVFFVLPDWVAEAPLNETAGEGETAESTPDDRNRLAISKFLWRRYQFKAPFLTVNPATGVETPLPDDDYTEESAVDWVRRNLLAMGIVLGAAERPDFDDSIDGFTPVSHGSPDDQHTSSLSYGTVVTPPNDQSSKDDEF